MKDYFVAGFIKSAFELDSDDLEVMDIDTLRQNIGLDALWNEVREEMEPNLNFDELNIKDEADPDLSNIGVGTRSSA